MYLLTLIKESNFGDEGTKHCIFFTWWCISETVKMLDTELSKTDTLFKSKKR